MKRRKSFKTMIGFLLIPVIALAVSFIVSNVSAKAAKKVTVAVLIQDVAEEGGCRYTYYTKGKFKGLLKGIDDGNGRTLDYSYSSGGKFKKAAYSYGSSGEEYTSKYKYNKKGRVSKATSGKAKLSLKYNAKGLIVKETYTGKSYNNGTVKYSYNRKGLITKAVYKDSSDTITYTYQYDKKKNIKKVVEKYKSEGKPYTYIFKNTYSKGRLVKRTCKESEPVKYKYKKYKVSKAMAKVIKKQQWALINNGNYSPCGGALRQKITTAFPYIH